MKAVAYGIPGGVDHLVHQDVRAAGELDEVLAHHILSGAR